MIIDGRKITAVVSDFDGTLVEHGKYKLPEGFFDIMNGLLGKGIRFVAASGRQYPNLYRMLSPISDRIGYIAENGALVAWGDKVLRRCTVERELAMRLISDLRKRPGSEILVSGAGTSYIVPNSEEYAYTLEHVLNNVVTRLEDFDQVPEEMLKISIFYPGGIPEADEQELRQGYGEKLLVVQSGSGWLDFMPAESGKGNALRLLAQELELDLNTAVAFGDSENDISMLEEAGVSFAMENASERVKAAAGHVCGSVMEVLRKAVSRHS